MRLLIIGQTPPPYGGQSINIEKMIKILEKNHFDLKFIRMDFSDELSENGKVAFIKIWRLIKIFTGICYNLIFYRPDYIYYPVSGAEKVPILRDIILLFPIRLFKKKVIYHFHAGGLSEIYPFLGSVLKSLYRFAYFNPHYAICMSSYGTRDPEFIKAQNIAIIPNGVNDPGSNVIVNKNAGGFQVLFVGVCRESKGIIDFVNVIALANKANPTITGTIIGTIFGEKEKVAIEYGVANGYITYLGVKTGADKEMIFRQSDIFLFPTFFEHENFPTVNLEAFSFKLPVVTTKWRGGNDQVQHGENGYLHNVHDIEGMANSIITAYGNKIIYKQLSDNAYKAYLENYTAKLFEERILDFFGHLQ